MMDNMNTEILQKRRERLLSVLKMNISDKGKKIVERQLDIINKRLSTLNRWF